MTWNSACGDCVYFFPVSEVHNVGECRRRSPFAPQDKRPGSIETETEYSACFGINRQWPQTKKKDFCGDFERK